MTLPIPTFGMLMCVEPKDAFIHLNATAYKRIQNRFKRCQPAVQSFLKEYGEDYMHQEMLASSLEIASCIFFTYDYHGVTLPSVSRATLERHLRTNEELALEYSTAKTKGIDQEELDALYFARPQPRLRAIVYNDVWQLHKDNDNTASEGAFERMLQIEKRMQVLLGAVLDSFDQTGFYE